MKAPTVSNTASPSTSNMDIDGASQNQHAPGIPNLPEGDTEVIPTDEDTFVEFDPTNCITHLADASIPNCTVKANQTMINLARAPDFNLPEVLNGSVLGYIRTAIISLHAISQCSECYEQRTFRDAFRELCWDINNWFSDIYEQSLRGVDFDWDALEEQQRQVPLGTSSRPFPSVLNGRSFQFAQYAADTAEEYLGTLCLLINYQINRFFYVVNRAGPWLAEYDDHDADDWQSMEWEAQEKSQFLEEIVMSRTAYAIDHRH